MPISIFTTIEAAVTTRQAAEFYGQMVSPNGMTLCLFHDDHTPSMKVDGRYYCFACGEYGNSINYVAKLFGLSNYEAAKKIAADFGISTDETTSVEKAVPKPNIEQRCFLALNRYRQLLIAKKDYFAPQSFDGPFTFTYGDADSELMYMEHLLNVFLEPYGNRRQHIIDFLQQDGRLEELERYLYQFRKEVNT